MATEDTNTLSAEGRVELMCIVARPRHDLVCLPCRDAGRDGRLVQAGNLCRCLTCCSVGILVWWTRG